MGEHDGQRVGAVGTEIGPEHVGHLVTGRRRGQRPVVGEAETYREEGRAQQGQDRHDGQPEGDRSPHHDQCQTAPGLARYRRRGRAAPQDAADEQA